ncbi:MAG: DNA polymerase III subunit gamma/tau [Acidimicrobiia bacterium]
MSFQALYRKYRPQRFGELVGQEHITVALRNAVRDDRVGHAYLFSGPRGNGKTTTARILAKALNCLELGADGEPCGQCENCVAIAAGTFGDLVEMDAASNRGVEDARNLVSRINLGLGATSKRKVYLLDEVHMLTKDASNTLLKSIEEPPPHVVFILATTEPEKVLPTIRSRTQHFEFTYLTVEEISGLLASVLADEGVEFEAEALPLVARAAAGSARDSESLLDLVLAGGGPVTVASVEAALGGAPLEMRMTILDAVAAEDVAGVLIGVRALLDAAHDPRRIAEGLLSALRDAFVTVASRGRIEIDEPEDVQARLATLGETMGNAALVRALETLGQAIVDMRGVDAADPRLVLEIALVRLARRETNVAVASLADRVDRLEARLAGGGAASPPPPAAPTPPAAEGSAVETPGVEAPTRSSRPKALGALRKAAAAQTSAAPAPTAADPEPAPPGVDSTPEVSFGLDDAVLAWAQVLAGVPRSLQAAVMEAQPLRVDGNVIVFGVARNHIDAVRPKFQKNADAIREAFIRELGTVPRFSFSPHEWGEGEGPPHRLVANQPVTDPEPEIDIVEVVDTTELVDAPITEGPAVDSISRLEDALGATVVEEQTKS